MCRNRRHLAGAGGQGAAGGAVSTAAHGGAARQQPEEARAELLPADDVEQKVDAVVRTAQESGGEPQVRDAAGMVEERTVCKQKKDSSHRDQNKVACHTWYVHPVAFLP